MSARLVAASFCMLLTANTVSQNTVLAGDLAGNNEFYWPAYQKGIEFKVKAHAIRGSLSLSPAEEVTIGEHVYRKVVATAEPSGLPGQHKAVYLRSDSKGLYARYTESSDDKEVTELTLPAKEGVSWQTHDQDGNVSTRKIEAITDCDIRGITFEGCVKVSFESPGGAAVAFYAPKFGEIVNSRKNGFMRRIIKTQ